MSAASRLWHRAPLWRFSLFCMIFFVAVTLVWPAAWLLRAVPQLARVTTPIAHFLGRDHSSPPPSENGGANPAPPSPEGSAAGGGEQSAAGQQPEGDHLMASAPPIDTELHGVIPLAGRQLPLPAGIWHPVLTMQDGPHGEIISNVLVRSVKGVVTGVIVARGSTQSVPEAITDRLSALCHDDRNYESRVIAEGNGTLECLSTRPVVLDQKDVSAAPDINLAYRRLRLMGFELPPLLIEGYWARAVTAKDGGIDFEAVSTAVSPAPAGSRQLTTPLGDWSKPAIGSAPLAGRFVAAMNRWMEGWSGVLQQGFEGRISDQGVPERVSQDPSPH